MDWNAAIEKHREALKRIVARSSPWSGSPTQASLVLLGCSDAGGTLPRHLHRAVLRLLRPAKSAARRLVIALARGLPAPPPAPAQGQPAEGAKTKILPTFLRNGVGTVLAPGVPPPGAPTAAARAAGPLSFPLLDPLRQWSAAAAGRRTSLPRICVLGVTERLAIAARKPPLPDDPVDAGHLGGRLAALAHVLDDLPGQARRFARWKARRDHALAAGRIHRSRRCAAAGHRRSPVALRSGRPASAQHPRSRRDPGARPRAGPVRPAP